MRSWLRHKATQLAGPALGVLTAYMLWRLLNPEDTDDAEELELCALPKCRTPTVPRASSASRSPGCSRRQRRPSFEITNEIGELRGSLEDASASGWGWQVQDKPLVVESTGSVPPPALRHSSSEEERLVRKHLEPGVKRSVRFRLDRTGEGDGFYGFVFDFSGRCVAHGADGSFVGLTLPEVLARTENKGVDGEQLHRQFVAAAEAGGGWVSYPWRNTARATMRLKGAYVIKVSQWGREYYAGVGYSLVAPQGRASRAGSGLYGFVFDGKGVCIAHGASPKFIGLTLGQIATLAHNSQLDSSELLQRFVAAARRGGGWVRYAWRNAPEEPLREKGAFITCLQPPAGASASIGAPSGSVSSGLGSGNSSMDYDKESPLWGDAGEDFPFGPGEAATGAEPAEERGYFVGFGTFGPPSESAEAAVAVPPSRAAAKAATKVLRRQLLAADAEGQLDAVVQDAAGTLATSAAEAFCWDELGWANELPEELATVLREHTKRHIGALGHTEG